MDLLSQVATGDTATDPSPWQPAGEATDEALKRAVRAAIARLTPVVVRDRRRYVRHPLPMLMELTPVDAETEKAVGNQLIVIGKSLSEHGIGFFHQHAIPYRHAVVRLEDATKGEMAFLVDLAWCRYTRYGWYESGGRFVRLIDASAGDK